MSDSAAPWTIAYQALLLMGFPRQEYWNGLSCPLPGDLPNPGLEPPSSALAGGFFTTEPPGKSSTVAAHKHVWHCIIELPISSLWAQYEAFPNYIRAAFGNPREGKGFLGSAMVKNPPASAGDEVLVRSLGQEDLLEKGTATHSSILAWKIPWTEVPGGLQSMRSQRAGYEWDSEQSRERKDHVFKDCCCGTPDAAQVPALWVSSHPSPPESFLP